MSQRQGHSLIASQITRIVDPAGLELPKNEELEGTCLSAAILDPQTLDQVLPLLTPQDFTRDAYRRLWEACKAIREGGRQVDFALLANWLNERKELSQIGGVSGIAKLVNCHPAVASIDAVAHKLRELRKMRDVIQQAQIIAGQGYTWKGDPQEYIDEAEQRMFSLVHSGESSNGHRMNAYEMMLGYDKRIQDIAAGKVQPSFASGFPALDELTGGMRLGEVTIIAARPGGGKTSLVMQMALNIAGTMSCEEKLGVAMFSLEMPIDQLSAKTISMKANTPFKRVWDATLDATEAKHVTEAMTQISNTPLFVDDKPASTLMHIRAGIRQFQAEYSAYEQGDGVRRRIRLVIIDYLQLMGTEGRADNREQEISKISRGLKELAKDLEVHVIALAQLNRRVESREVKSKVPALSDLRESGAIEQDADVVQFIYRPEYYIADKARVPPCYQGLANIIVAKVRNGSPGTVPLYFNALCTRFDNPTKKDLERWDQPVEEEPAGRERKSGSYRRGSREEFRAEGEEVRW